MASFLPTNPRFRGVEIRGNTLLSATVQKKGGRWEISLEDLKDEDVIISAASSKEVLVRNCEIPLKKPKDLFAALDFHVEPLLPFPLEKAIIQGEIIHQHEKGSVLNIFAMRRDHLEKHLEALKMHQIEPEIVTCSSHALASFSTLLPPSNSPRLIAHEGEEEITLVFVEKGVLLASRSFEKALSFEAEIKKTILSFSSTHKAKSFEDVFCLSQNQSFCEALESACEKEISPLSTPFLFLKTDDLIRYGLAIGTALAHTGPNFRQKELVYPYRFRRIKKPLLVYSLLVTLLFFSFLGFGYMALAHKKESIQKRYVALLQAEGKKSGNDPTTPQEYLTSLNSLEKEIRDRPQTFPLIPGVPKAKEVLNWIVSLPQMQQIELDTFHYSLVKRPDFSHKHEHYKVKVDLEFSTKDPNCAKSLQESLRSPNLFIDPKEELVWSAGKGKYKATFYLKDKTRYG